MLRVACCNPSTPSAIADMTATTYLTSPDINFTLCSSRLLWLTSPCQGTAPGILAQITLANLRESVRINAGSPSIRLFRISSRTSSLVDLQSSLKMTSPSLVTENIPSVAWRNLVRSVTGNSTTSGLFSIHTIMSFSSFS